MKVESQLVENIDIGDRLRAVDDSKVRQLAESMGAVGLLNPIYVRYSDDQSECWLVAGAHRLAAAKLLGWDQIDTVELAGDNLTAQLAEIDENLCRAELTPTQEAEHLARRKEVWEAMREAERTPDLAGETGGATCTTSLSDGRAAGPQHEEGFAASTAKATGKNKSTVTRATRRATEVCQAARDLIRGTSLDTGAFLDRLIKRGFTDEEQVQHVSEQLDAIADKERRAQLAEEKKARAAAAKQEKEDARNEACNFLHEKLTAREWGYLIDMFERSGWSGPADALRAWEAPMAKAAA